MNLNNFLKILTLSAVLIITGCVAGAANNTISEDTAAKGRFPSVATSDLNGKEYSLPGDFNTGITLIALGFSHEQKEFIAEWFEVYNEIKDKFPGLSFYKIPVIDNSNAALRLMITNGMRAKADDYTRSITLPLFVNKTKFLDILEISDDKEPEIIIINNLGEILWSVSGKTDKQKSDALIKFLSKISKMKSAGP